MGFHALSSSRTRGAFHLVLTHLGGRGGGQVSYKFALRITCKNGGGGPDSM